MRKSVVLPAPLAPITPTMPPRGSEKLRSSISSRSPKPLRRCSASTTTSPRCVAVGMWICTWSSLTLRSWATSASKFCRRAFCLRLAPARVLAHPLELGRDRALARLIGLLLLGQALLLLLEPRGVVALVGDAPAAVQLEDPAGDVVEEVAIVGHRDDRALVLGQVTLQPRDRLGVEVVRGLVEEQQVRLAQQQAAQRDAAALTAGQRRDVGVGRRQAQRVHRVLDVRVEVPGVGGIDARLQVGELLGGLVGVVGGQLVEAIQERARPGDAVLDVAAHVLGLVQRGLLLEQADRGARGQHRVAAELGVEPRHDAQDRGLARAVVAEHADLGAGQERERDVLEDRPVGREDLRQAVHLEDVLGSHAAPQGTQARTTGPGRRRLCDDARSCHVTSARAGEAAGGALAVAQHVAAVTDHGVAAGRRSSRRRASRHARR